VAIWKYGPELKRNRREICHLNGIEIIANIFDMIKEKGRDKIKSALSQILTQWNVIIQKLLLPHLDKFFAWKCIRKGIIIRMLCGSDLGHEIVMRLK